MIKRIFTGSCITIPVICIIVTCVHLSCSSLIVEKPIEIDEKTDWLIAGGSPDNRNISKSDAGFRFPLNLYWEFDADAGFSRNCLSIADAVLFASTLKGECYAIDVSSGRSLGRIELGGAASYSVPAISGNSLILTSSGNRNARVVKASLVSGLLRWSRYVGFVESSPIIFNNDVFVCSANGKAYRLSLQTGNIVWSSSPSGKGRVPPQFYTSPVIAGGILVAGANNGTMYAFSVRDGKELWKYPTGASIFADASADSGRIFFGSDDGHFYCLDTSGTLIWKKELNTRFLSASTFFNDQVITAGIDGRVYSLNISDGNVKWAFTSKGPVSGTPVRHGDYIFFGSYDKRIYCIKAVDGSRVWSHETEGRLRSSPLIWKDYVFIAGDEKYIYCFSNKVMKSE